jgi:hypothetical protein
MTPISGEGGSEGPCVAGTNDRTGRHCDSRAFRADCASQVVIQNTLRQSDPEPQAAGYAQTMKGSFDILRRVYGGDKERRPDDLA